MAVLIRVGVAKQGGGGRREEGLLTGGERTWWRCYTGFEETE